MSAKAMGWAWDLQIDRELKFVLLAYADHADHEGRNVFPAINTIAHKTGYSRRAVQDITKRLVEAGLLIRDGDGVRGTRRWRIPLPLGGSHAAATGGAVSALPTPEGVQISTEGGADFDMGGAVATAPEPSITVNEPPEKIGRRATDPRTQTPEVQFYRELVGRYPARVNLDKVIEEFRGRTPAQIRDVYSTWCARGYNPFSLSWLEWIKSGIPTNGKRGNNGHGPAAGFDVKEWERKRREEATRALAVASDRKGGREGASEHN